ncbi:XRE family transcriptional regulator [Saccharopolyspora shandongensis]|uniref:Transcriptional regulator, XRE family with cupin sensor n=1 Tax=Saccharopolyspora shandongensis TaxID=418495 RepID=A0A1H3R845_9PSEU|nr:XRE family transcriptional regulator [Saccharopolyspora shandongensis]SDZ21683.1 transcriptional regulator, XRE family with cupin sensor [Saccharopolyspora shandongensis]
MAGTHKAPTGEQRGEGIGAQLKAIRMSRRKTLAELAERSGLTKGYLSKVERDQVNPSVASLMRLCEALEVSVSTFFAAAAGEVVRHGAYPSIRFGGDGMHEYLLTPEGERRVQAILSVIGPGGGSGDEPYVLPTGVEFVFVLEGRLRIVLAGEEITLETGDALTFAGDTAHTFTSVTDDGSPTRVLWILAPALATPKTG